jgi:quinol monooxygenase YgiN
MSWYAQHTRLVAVSGKRDELVAKFLQAAEIQRDNSDCSLLLVSTAQDAADIVYVTEVWSSEAAWKRASRSPAMQKWWAASMPALVAGKPESVSLNVVGGKGFTQR